MAISMTAVLGVVQTGLKVANMLIEAGKSAGPAITAVQALVKSAKSGKVTKAQIETTEETLDRLIAEFNEPMNDG